MNTTAALPVDLSPQLDLGATLAVVSIVLIWAGGWALAQRRKRRRKR